MEKLQNKYLKTDFNKMCLEKGGGEESNSYLKSCHPIKNKNFENKLVQQVKKKVFISI